MTNEQICDKIWDVYVNKLININGEIPRELRYGILYIYIIYINIL